MMDITTSQATLGNRDGKLRHDVAHGMSQFAEPLTDEEIANLAEYYSTEEDATR
ncbi:hypothetical protein P8631_02065 [Guyparkeria sp. 1SP6A2]|nr:hypothetical protein [Guyparkeria sp. 1SP6A2]